MRTIRTALIPLKKDKTFREPQGFHQDLRRIAADHDRFSTPHQGAHMDTKQPQPNTQLHTTDSREAPVIVREPGTTHATRASLKLAKRGHQFHIESP